MSATSWIAAIRIAGGESEPFYSAKLRVFYWDQGTNSDLIVKDVAGLRVLLADADASTVDHGDSSQTHLPLMLRGYVRPQKHDGNPGVELSLEGQGDTYVGTLAPEKPVRDVVLTPIGGWPQKLGSDIETPELRLTAGAVPARLAVNDSQQLVKFLKLDTKNGQSTLFGGFRLDQLANTVLPLTLVPHGVEFQGSLPDPTRDLIEGSTLETEARIRGRFRLERRPGLNGEPRYWLRLIGGHPDEPDSMERLEARIARAFGDLGGDKDTPLAIRFDRRGGTPPLLWPLNIEQKKLILITSAPGEFEMAIEPSAIDARLRTISRFPGDAPGVAAIHGERLAWRKKLDGFDVALEAGEGANAVPKIEIDFDRTVDGWTTSLKDTFETQPVEVPLDAVAARLLAVYKSGQVVAATAPRPPYAFLPLDDGWLQLGLAPARKQKLPSTEAPPSAMSGRIVAAYDASGDGARGVVIDEAVRLSLTIEWRKQGNAYRPVHGKLDVRGARGQLRGFVFVAETAPTAAEALPDLRRGPAATRDLPIVFNAQQTGLALKGTFLWKPDEWKLEVTELLENLPPDAKIEPSPAGRPSGYGWQQPYDRAFITNHPLTRAAVTPAEPSVSRGLLRYAFDGPFTLTNAPGGEAPALSVEHPAIHDVEPVSFVADTLVHTTLPGLEFVTRQWPAKKGQFSAALRNDLSILDELFAWSDPPPPKSGTPPPPATEGGSVVVTALDPARLEEVWRQNRDRMALTQTQDAFMTGWIGTGAVHLQDIETLVQPHVWKGVKVKVDLEARWGAYQLNGETYQLDAALAGLRGEFDVANDALVAGGEAIVVRGQAASMFRRDGSALVWDSRGTGLGSAAADGVRPFGHEGKPLGALRTLRQVESIKLDGAVPWMKATPLAFYMRDLPFENGVFDGAKNPVENALGAVGQAFDRADFPRALHEWRLMEAKTGEPKPFDVRFGPFLFRPLRLSRVALDETGAIKVIAVIGSLRIGRRSKPSGSTKVEAAPFGPDRIYERADLFRLTLTRNGSEWTPAWEGVALKQPDLEKQKLEFGSRDPKISCAVPLAVDAKTGIPSARQANVDATIELDIKSYNVRLGTRLFGRTCELESQAEIGTTINFSFKPIGAAATKSLVMLRVDEIAVLLAADSQTIRIAGALQVTPDKSDASDEARALVHVGHEAASFRWLDLPAADRESDLPFFFIDHASGRVSVGWDGSWAKSRPLFGLEAADGWETKARLEAFVASSETLKTLAPLAAATAWARVAGLANKTKNRIDHRLRFDARGADHHLELTWEASFPSPVRWPVNGLRKTDGHALPDAWRKPAEAYSEEAGRSRAIRIDAGETLTHAVKARFRGHRIEAGELKRAATGVTPLKPIMLLAEVEHRLERDQRSVTFTTLDHVAVTSLRLVSETAQAYAFAPRYAGSQRTYRGQSTANKVPHPGIVQLPWAVSGFFDEALVRFYATKAFNQLLDVPVFLGGAAVEFPYLVGDEQRSVTAVVPWAGLYATLQVPLGSLTQAGGRWEVASPDLWGGTAHIGPSARRTMVVASPAGIEQIRSVSGSAGLTPPDQSAVLARVMPVEQLFFENLRQGSGGKLEIGAAGDIQSAPFFLRALMAIEARWNATPAEDSAATWRALSLHPARGSAGGTTIDPVVGVEIRPSVPQAAAEGAMAPADLVALSARRATLERAYRLVHPDHADDAGDLNPRAELIARARDLDRFAECVIREVEIDDRTPGVTVVDIPSPRVLRGPRDGVAIDHPTLAPSPALGWPSATATDGLDKLAPRLGGERPVQSAEAGFAARFRQISLPAHTTEAMTYLAFDHRVTYRRDLRVPFAGPAARHLSPVNARLRAPVEAALGAPDDTGPVLPPLFELATIGRRPGVFEVVTAAVTVAAEGEAFDREHARFGRPASSGPVVAHQLRTPRSPALPDDAADIAAAGGESTVLNLRRRTYLSLADGRRADPGAPFILDRFGAFAESADVVRDENDGKQLRVALSLTATQTASQAAVGLVGPNWDGVLAIKFDAVAAGFDDPEGTPDKLKGELERLVSIRTARLEIGEASFVMEDKPASVVAWPSFNWTLSAAHLLAAARDALRRAGVDTPIRLAITFGGLAPLPQAPRLKATLPLALDPGDRRVLGGRTRTIAFGDPSYDRQLGSEAEGDIDDIGGARALLSVDRKEYDSGATLYFACGALDPASGLFASKSPAPNATVRFRRFGRPNPDGAAPAP